MKAFAECEHCIYAPCDKAGNERAYCFVRYLIWESDEQNRRRKEKRNGKTDDPQ